MEVNTETQGTETVEQQSTTQQAASQQAPPKLKSAGAPKAVTTNDGTRNVELRTKDAGEPSETTTVTNTTKTDAPNTEEGTQTPNTETPPANKELTDLLARYKVNTLEELDAKLAGNTNTTAAATPKTPEETQAEASALDRKMLDAFIAIGGNIEAYATLKNLAAASEADLTTLSQSELRAELLQGGFSEQEAEQMIAERYATISEEDLEQFEDESDKAFAKRKNEFIQKKLLSRGTRKQQSAKEFLDKLRNDVEETNLLGTKEKEFSSKVDEHLQSLPKKVTLQLGKVNDLEVAPIDYNVSDQDIEEVASVLKDPSKRQQFLYNEDGSLNIKNLTDVMLKARYADELAKVAYLESGTRQVKIVESVFPMNNASTVGVGGSTTKAVGQAGKTASAGKPVAVNSPRRK